MSVTTADAVSLLTVFVAVMVTVCCVAMLAGAAYKALYDPFGVNEPKLCGLMDHETDALQDTRTVDVNCCDCPPYSVTALGAMTWFSGDNE